MEDYVKSKLKTKLFQKLKTTSGCINSGIIYNTDRGKVFVKYNSASKADVMFEGEFESLKEIVNTGTVRVPRPIVVGSKFNEAFIAMEFLEMSSLRKFSSHLGKSLAEMHLLNLKNYNRRVKTGGFVTDKNISVVEKFGFHVPTACGLLAQNNNWADDWVSFYVTQKLQPQIDMIVENNGNREILDLWSHLIIKIPTYFKDQNVFPSLLHGDLWFGNAGETDNEPVIYDPAAFYGHHEFDLAIALMFGGFEKKFYDSYHNILPKANGFEKRHQLYVLFHHLNHWNHFGSHKNSSLNIMREIIKGN